RTWDTCINCDWSSYLCSSDLPVRVLEPVPQAERTVPELPAGAHEERQAALARSVQPAGPARARALGSRAGQSPAQRRARRADQRDRKNVGKEKTVEWITGRDC